MSCPVSPRNLAIAAAALFGVYIVYKYFGNTEKKSKKETPTTTTTTPTPSTNTTASVVVPAPKSSSAINAIVISGPSGVGKGTLIDRIKKEFASAFAVSVSHTSRAPRAGEVNGQHYHFSDKDTMTQMEKNGEFLELCNVHGNFYGTTIAALDAVRKSGKVCVIEVDVQGSQKIKKALAASGSDLSVAYMFVSAPSYAELEQRITKRGGESEDKIKVRLETAKKEMAFLEQSPSHFDFVLVNDDLEKSYASFVNFLKEKGALKQ
jgi:guanylate kinase